MINRITATLMLIICVSAANYGYADVANIESTINKIIKSKQLILEMVKPPNSVVFNERLTKVKNNTITLTFTVTNSLGLSETFIRDVNAP